MVFAVFLLMVGCRIVFHWEVWTSLKDACLVSLMQRLYCSLIRIFLLVFLLVSIVNGSFCIFALCLTAANGCHNGVDCLLVCLLFSFSHLHFSFTHLHSSFSHLHCSFSRLRHNFACLHSSFSHLHFSVTHLHSNITCQHFCITCLYSCIACLHSSFTHLHSSIACLHCCFARGYLLVSFCREIC